MEDMTMKKMIIITLAAVVAAASLVACGNTNATGNNGTTREIMGVPQAITIRLKRLLPAHLTESVKQLAASATASVRQLVVLMTCLMTIIRMIAQQHDNTF